MRTLSSTFCSVLCAAALFVACSSGSSGTGSGTDLFGDTGATPDAGGGDTATPDGASDATIGTGSSANGALTIVSLTPTSPTMTGGEPLATETSEITFIAIVTDHSGLDAIAGGQLMDDSGATFAAFGAGANKGTYSATVDWSAMNTIHATDFGPTGGSRTFIAKFFDNQGNVATAQVVINLACRTSATETDAACGGVCTHLIYDPNHCGACGTACTTTTQPLCIESKCGPILDPYADSSDVVQTSCTGAADVGPGTTCSKICATRGFPWSCLVVDGYSASDATCAGEVDPHANLGCDTDLSARAIPFVCACGYQH